MTADGPDGMLTGMYEPEQKGTYTFVVRMDGREMTTGSVTVHGDPTGNGDGGISIYVFYTLGALVLLVIALVIGLKRRG